MSNCELVSYKEARELIGVSERTLKRMVEDGELSEYSYRSTKRLSRVELLTPRRKRREDA